MADISPRERVWQVVGSIPRGSVATYGQVAALAGLPRAARFVGTVLRHLPADTRLPWHRVIGADGRISLSAESPSASLQRQALESEGLTFLNGRINLRLFGWLP